MQRPLLFAVLVSAALGLVVRWAVPNSRPATEVFEASSVVDAQAPRVLAASDSIGPLLAVGSEGALVFTVDSSTILVHAGATLDIQGQLRTSGSVGDAGQVLTSGGAGQPPAWKTLADLITSTPPETSTTTTTVTTDITQTPTGGHLLIADGDSWESLAVGGDAGLSAAGTLTIAANAVALTTDTTGNYVATIAATSSGTVTVTNGTGEGSAVTLDVTGLNCSDCLDADQIKDIYVLTSGDTISGTLTLTGVVDAGGALSFEVPNGAAPTVDTTGELAVDTSGDDLIYYGGSAQRNLSYKQTKTATLESPADADNFMLFKAPYALTISNIKCVVDPAGTGESVVITVEERDSNGDSAAGVDGATTITCANTSTADDGSLSNAGIDANDWVSLDIGTVTGTVTQMSVTITYTKDAE